MDSGYFNTDHSGRDRESFDNPFSMDPALFTPSIFINLDAGSHSDLDNILGNGLIDGLPSGAELTPGLMNGGYTWDAQATTYSPYPDMSHTQNLAADQQLGAGLTSGDMVNGYGQNGLGIQAVPFSENQLLRQMDGSEATMALDQTSPTSIPAKRKSEAGIEDGTPPKPKKKRGPRKTKIKSEAEKRAKEERKLERNRLAASKCRQKKKEATEGMMERFNELERQNQWMKACIEEFKQERNSLIAMILQHKNCGHADIDMCLENQLVRIASEVDGPCALSQVDQFMSSNPSSPATSSQPRSRRNSNGSNTSRPGSSYHDPSFAAQPQQTWAEKYPAGYLAWQQQFSTPQGHQLQHPDSPTSSSEAGSLMSRQNSSRTSVSEKNDSGISNVDTPPEERRKAVSDTAVDEAISLVSGVQMMGKPSMMRKKMAVGPSDLKDPSAFLSSLKVQ